MTATTLMKNRPDALFPALFRGINVGGNAILSMRDLVALLEDLGSIKERRGFEPDVFLLDLIDMESVVVSNPFPEAESEPASEVLSKSHAVSAQRRVTGGQSAKSWTWRNNAARDAENKGNERK